MTKKKLKIKNSKRPIEKFIKNQKNPIPKKERVESAFGNFKKWYLSNC
jgi:hypothetical protein